MAKPRLDDPLTIEQLRAMLDYDPATGNLIWRHRPGYPPQWNGKWAGRIAGTRCGGFIGIKIRGRGYKAHRLIWFLHYETWPAEDIDHANGKWDDNRLANLRLATRTQNNANQRLSKTNRSGLKGVSWDKKRLYWKAQIHYRSKNYRLGEFDNPIDAYNAYCEAALRLHGKYARLK